MALPNTPKQGLSNLSASSTTKPSRRSTTNNNNSMSRPLNYPFQPKLLSSTPRSSTTMSDAALGDRPSLAVLSHDRSRDYYIDQNTLDAAMGSSAPKVTGLTDCGNSNRPNLLQKKSIKKQQQQQPTEISSRSSSISENVQRKKSIAAATAGVASNGSMDKSQESNHHASFWRINDDKDKNNKKDNSPDNSDMFDFKSFDESEKNSKSWFSSLIQSSKQNKDQDDNSQSSGNFNDYYQTLEDANNTVEMDTSNQKMSINTFTDSKIEDNERIMNVMHEEELRILEAERQEKRSVIQNILTDEQKIAYVGLVYLTLVEMQARLNVQYKEAVESTASFLNFSRRIMQRIYYHITLTREEQRMIELLPRHDITTEDMRRSLLGVNNKDGIVMVKTDQQVAIAHAGLEVKPKEKTSPRSSESDVVGRKEPNQSTKKGDDIDSPEDLGALMSPDSEKTKNNVLYQHSQTPEWPDDKAHRNSATSSSGSPMDHDKDSAVSSFSDQDSMPEKTPVTKIDPKQPLMIDIRASIILDFFLLLLDNDVYDGRGRYLLRRISEVLDYPWESVLACERRITSELALHDYAAEISVEGRDNAATAAKRENDKGRVKRYVVMGLVTAGGGLVMGLSAGLLAPAIGAGIGATLGAVGLAHGGAFFGGVGGTALIATSGVLTGTGLAGFKIARRTKGAQDFQFIPQANEQQTNIILTIPGWLGKSDNGTFSFSSIDKVNGDHYSLLWEQDELRRLGSSLRIIASEVISTTLLATLQHTVLPSLLGPLSVPLWLVKLGYVLDNPWTTCCDLAKRAGTIIAEVLLQRVQGYRPVTLVGYSVGARMIFYCLLELARMNAYGIIEDVCIFGAPVVESKEQWRLATSVVGGRFINGYSNRDWILSFYYRTTKLSRDVVAGLSPIEDVSGITNIDISEEIPGHNAYYTMMPVLLEQIGIVVDSAQLQDPDDNSEITSEERELKENIHKVAAEIENKEKKKWWSFWGAGGGSSKSAPPTSVDQQQGEDENKSRNEFGSERNLSNPTLSAGATATNGEISMMQPMAHVPSQEHDMDTLTKEFENLGIPFNQVETTLPPLVIDPKEQGDPPAVKSPKTL